MNHNSIFDILKSKPRVVVDKIYQETIWACQATFQSLKMLSRCIVMRIIFLESVFTLNELVSVMNKATYEVKQEVVDELVSLYIILEESTGSTVHAEIEIIDMGITNGADFLSKNLHKLYRLNPSFQKSFRKAIVQPVRPFANKLESDDPNITSTFHLDPNPPSPEQIEKHSYQEWNRLLSYLVGLISQKELPYQVIHAFAVHHNLIGTLPPTSTGTTQQPSKTMITSKGYEYILKDYLTQVWEFILSTLERDKFKEQEDSILSILFIIPYLQYGKGYPMNLLSSAQQQFVFELSTSGIIYLTSDYKFFYISQVAMQMIFGRADTTTLATTQATSSSSSSNTNSNNTLSFTSNSQSKLSIIVETNLQITAFVSDDLHIALLRLFMDIHVRMPNMVIGRITREKAKDAFRMGIKAAQIIDFLLLHAHPTTQKRKGQQVVPENVTDQLILWENEMYRIQEEPCIFFDLDHIINASLFDELIQHLQSQQTLLWMNQDKKMIACIPHAKEDITLFINRKLYS